MKGKRENRKNVKKKEESGKIKGEIKLKGEVYFFKTQEGKKGRVRSNIGVRRGKYGDDMVFRPMFCHGLFIAHA
jgi:hypothetical protein